MTVPRTDLALEAAEDLTAAGRFAALGSGVSKWECLQGGCPVTHIRVRDRAAAEALGRPVGQYLTIDLRPALARQEGLTRRASSCLAQQLRTLLPPPDALRRRKIFGAGGQIIGGLQRQIGTWYGHFCGERSLLNTKCCGLRIA